MSAGLRMRRSCCIRRVRQSAAPGRNLSVPAPESPRCVGLQRAPFTGKPPRDSGAIPRECIAKCFAQRLEPGLIVTPLVQTLAIDRLAHLLRARRTYAPFGLVELDTGRLELELTIIQQSTYRSFQIVHDVFVLY